MSKAQPAAFVPLQCYLSWGKNLRDDNGLITVETPLREVPDHPRDSSGTQTLTFSCHQAGPLPFRP
jgi:hypothetical protein